MSAPFVGLQTMVMHFVPAVAKPLAIAVLIFSRSADFFENATTDGPAPLMVTPVAPAFRA